MNILIFLITPFLGCLRNYVKYKQFKFLLFIRTPITHFIFSLLLLKNKHDIWKVLIFERWFFLLYKSFLSIYNDDYHKKRYKYEIKYGLEYGKKYGKNSGKKYLKNS